MGLINRFEKGLDRAVNGVFAKAFRSEVQPVEIASALRRECDEKAAVVTRDRTVVPNAFVVELGSSDHERLGEWEQALGAELAGAVSEHARQQRYGFVGPVSVTFEQAEDLDTGVFRVRSQTGPAGAPGVPAASAPPPGPAGPHGPPGPSAPPGLPAAPVGAPLGAAGSWDAYASAPQYPGAPAPTAPAPPAWPAAPAGPAPSLDVDGRIYRLAQPVTVIGRSSDADVVLDDAGASRRHAEVHLVDGRARVIDLGSTNGTFVDGERVHAGNLAEGSTITVGRTRIVFHSGQW